MFAGCKIATVGRLVGKRKAMMKNILKYISSFIAGVMLNYSQSTSGQPRMVFSFDFVTQDQITEEDEG